MVPNQHRKSVQGKQLHHQILKRMTGQFSEVFIKEVGMREWEGRNQGSIHQSFPSLFVFFFLRGRGRNDLDLLEDFCLFFFFFLFFACCKSNGQGDGSP